MAKAKADRARTGSTIRCAIYTRKSSDEASSRNSSLSTPSGNFLPRSAASFARRATSFGDRDFRSSL